MAWASEWNEKVDKEAKAANCRRPPWFQQVWDQFENQWRNNRQTLLQIARFHLAIAEVDIAGRKHSPGPDLESDCFDVHPFLHRPCEPSESSISLAIDSLPVDWLYRLSALDEFSFLAYRKLLDWMLHLERHATCTILVSFVELCFSFRMSLGHSLGALYSGAGGNLFLSSTFASELRIFVSIFRRMMKALDIVESSTKVDLSDLGVDIPLVGVLIPWPGDDFGVIHDSIRRFVGQRRVKGPQGWAKPWLL